MENKELLQAIGQMIFENNQKMTAEMSEMMDKKLEPIQQDISGIKSDISGMNSDISSLKDGQESLQEKIVKINITLENDIDKKLTALFDAHKLDSEKINHISETVDSMNDAYAATDMIARMNTAQINKLKSKIG